MKNAAPRVSIVQIVFVNASAASCVSVTYSTNGSSFAVSRWRRRSSRPAGRLRAAGRRRRSARSAHHAALVPRAELAHDQPHRHRVEHLVADHHAFESRRAARRAISPSRRARARRLRSSRAGARAVRPTDRRSSSCRTARPDRASAFSKPAASLPVPAPNSIRSRVPLAASACATGPRQRRGEQRRQFRRGDEVAAVFRRGGRISSRRRCNSRGRARTARAPYSGRTAASRPRWRCSARISAVSASDCASASGPGAGKLSDWSSFRIHPSIVNERFFLTPPSSARPTRRASCSSPARRSASGAARARLRGARLGRGRALRRIGARKRDETVA